MSKAAAKAYYDKQIGDPDVGYITPQDAKDAIEVMYTDLDLVGTSRLVDGAVTTPKLADGAVTDAKLSGGIDGAKINGLGNLATPNQASGTDTLGTTAGFFSFNSPTVSSATG